MGCSSVFSGGTTLGILDCQPFSLGATSLQGLIPGDCIKQIPTEAKVHAPDAQHCDHNLCLATSLQASELHHLSFTEGRSCTSSFDHSRRNPDLANLILAPSEAGL